ncbi:Zn(II)2Cys6 transcription factor [Aspergillus undulatus]|uniref:Zn(II)2Cys6 transcription factor n=1 Tax=Aspergillus undulatus TaxID=1810928 RepID=UPI003CCD622F
MLTPEAQSKFRPRRRHRKSRNGCMECKRRRIKCDEEKPSCGRCILTMQECIYQPPLATAHSSASEPEQSHIDRPLSLPTPSPRSGQSPSLSTTDEISRLSLSRLQLVEPTQSFDFTFSLNFDTSDTGLYHHYLQHTSRNLTSNTRDFHALQVCLPTLALRSRTVYHSILAVSAACMCCDMIYRDPPPDVSTVSNILMTGYRHYNAASERLRELISRPRAANAEPLLAAPPLLVPFATSSQQINHWISNRRGGAQVRVAKPLASTPLDVIILSRGITATIRALEADAASSPGPISIPANSIPEDIDSMDSYSPLPTSPATLPTPPSHHHPMYHIIKETSGAAFSKLQERLDAAIFFSPGHSKALSACAEALEILSTLRSAAFTSISHYSQATSNPLDFPSPLPIQLPLSMTRTPNLPQVPSWLVDFTARPSTPSCTDHLTRPFLSFLPLVPMAYLDLILPLLDRRLEGPAKQDHANPHVDPALQTFDGELDLSIEQALALDIYAHWSVLMFLVGEESWWIGKLPDITLAGMVNRFGDGFVHRFWPGGDANSDTAAEGVGDLGEWWPRSMLRIEREIGRYR